MRGDFSRYTFDPKKRYSGVWKQQGRVQVDADWNEQQEISRNRIETECRDVVGQSGAPSADPGFNILVRRDYESILIGKGRYYVDGILCENDYGNEGSKYVDYISQPDLKGAPEIRSLLADTKRGIVYLDVWQRGITAIDDPRIKEKALGGADTAIRSQTVWQVKVLPVAAGVEVCGKTLFPNRNVLMNAKTGESMESQDLCILKASGGYRRLENQLYRVEIHQSGDLKSARFKWAADNGCMEIPAESISGSTVTIPSTSAGLLQNFKDGTIVEVADDYSELSPSIYTRPLIKVIRDPANQENEINLTPPIELDPKPTKTETSSRHFRLRRWDGESGLESQENDGWIPLGNEGIEVKFSTGGSQSDQFHAGDFWLIPARVCTGELEWPPYEIPNKSPEPQPPLGIIHHYATLAEIRMTPHSRKLELVKDCRIVFPSLAELDARCRNSCTITPAPGEGWEAELDKIGDANDVRICFQVGEYPVPNTVLFRNKKLRDRECHITISGVGPGTRITARSAESVFRFEYCDSVAVRNLCAESHVSGFGIITGMNDLNGTLTFCGCKKVDVENVTLICASDAERTAACITVRDMVDGEPAVSAEMVRIHDCDLKVGHQQSGIILINAKRCQVLGNLIAAAARDRDITFETLLQNPRYRSSVRRLMIHDAKLMGQTAAKAIAKAKEGETPKETKEIDLVALSVSNRMITLKTDPALVPVWESWFKLDSPLGVQSSKDLLFHTIKTADKVLLNHGILRKMRRTNEPFEGFKNWYNDLKAADKATAKQGIVIGGTSADEVSIKDNSINDVHQGIHIGFGQGAGIAGDKAMGKIIRISGNNIRVLLSPTTREREGIFVGSVSSLFVENNYIEVTKFKSTERLLIDGIKVRGSLGKMAIVRGNHIVGTSTPIRFKPLNQIDGKPVRIIADNWPTTSD